MSIKRLVVKVGTSTLTHPTGFLNLRCINILTRTLCDLKNSGIEVALVTSGAVGVGMSKLGLKNRPTETRMKQAVAAVGQAELIDIYGKMFGEYGSTVAQILLTKDVLDAGDRQVNAKNTLESLLSLGVVPIVNENDTISVEQIELEFGDNDTLSAYVAKLMEADMLVILSDIDGVYDCDPHKNKCAKLIQRIDVIDEKIHDLAGGAGSKTGTGGMITKIQAAEIATSAGIETVIANGENPAILYGILDGTAKGTVFTAKK